MRILLFMGWMACLSAQAQQVRISGVVRDSQERLPLAHVMVLPDSIAGVADRDGKFTVTVPAGRKTVTASFTGYRPLSVTLEAARDTVIQLVLTTSSKQLDEVVITSQRMVQEEILQSTRTGTNVLKPSDITSIPVLGGEADPIKVLQLMPGTVRGVEGSSDLFVRGGAADQNLVLLDDATIYNTSHLFGFVSVFNPDILQSVESVNGGFPANYGGRLSSILNVTTQSDLASSTHVSGDIGLIASRLYIEQPIVKDKASFWIAGRRTYIDQVVKAVGEELPYFFYDINAKVMWSVTPRDDISASFYSGEDILDIFRDRDNNGRGFLTTYESGNNSQSVRWRHRFADGWEGTLSLLHTAYRYNIQNRFEDNRLLAFSDIDDIGTRVSMNKQTRSGAWIRTGFDWTRHNVSPSVLNTSGSLSELVASTTSVGRQAHEMAWYAHYEWSLSKRWLANAGLRTSMALVRNRTFAFPEPRLSLRYALDDHQALKFSYARMVQYMHRISNSAVTSPTDVWYPVTERVQPQTAHHVAVAWQRSFPSTGVFVSIESYYKYMNNLVGLEEGTNLFLDTDFEPRLIQGKGRAYGLEVLLRKETGKLTGWISYTLSRSTRQFDAVNQGQWFPSRYDRRHNGAIVLQYALHQRWSVSLVWEFISGARFTPVIGQYVVTAPSNTGVVLLPVYAPINSVKLADAHRLDVGIKFKSKAGKKFRYEWFAGVYNVYNRANPIGITITEDEANGSLRYEQPGLFGLLPFISYGFKF
jgi:hypothetical protein